MKLFESEQKVMEVLWEEGEIPAKRVVEVLSERVGWNKIGRASCRERV